MPLSLQQQYQFADYVVLATISATKLNTPAAAWSTAGRVDVTIKPVEFFKGDPAQLPALHSVRSGASCGVPMTRGSTYLLFFRQEGFISLCSGSRPAFPSATGEAAADLQATLEKLRSFGASPHPGSDGS